MTKQEIAALGCGYAVLFCSIFLVTQCPQKGCFVRGSTGQPTSFTECVAAGNPVQDGTPRRCVLASGTVFLEQAVSSRPPRSEVRLQEPLPGSGIGVPLSLKGTVSGERGEVHYQLVDVDGTVLAEGVADTPDAALGQPQAFSAQVSYPAPFGQTGAIMLRAMSRTTGDLLGETRVPITFKNQGTQDVQVYFLDATADPDREQCDVVRAFPRRVSASDDGIRQAMDALLAGPTDRERRDGAQTAIPTGVTLQSMTFIAGTLRIDFSPEMLAEVQGNCRLAGIRAMLQNTLRQFPTVKRLEITVDGRSAPALVTP